MRKLPPRFSSDPAIRFNEYNKCFLEAYNRLVKSYGQEWFQGHIPDLNHVFFLDKESFEKEVNKFERRESPKRVTSHGYTPLTRDVILLNIDPDTACGLHPLHLTQVSAHETLHIASKNLYFPSEISLKEAEGDAERIRETEKSATEMFVDYLASYAIGLLDVPPKFLPDSVLPQTLAGYYLLEVLKGIGIRRGTLLMLQTFFGDDYKPFRDELNRVYDNPDFYKHFVFWNATYGLLDRGIPVEQSNAEHIFIMQTVASRTGLKYIRKREFEEARERGLEFARRVYKS